MPTIDAMADAFIEFALKDFPFEVEKHDRMLLRVCGKVPDTVLCVEQQIYTWRVSEYTEPISYGRFWCFDNVGDALEGLLGYLANEEATEPDGWKRAIDFEGGYRVRRVLFAYGKREIIETED